MTYSDLQTRVTRRVIDLPPAVQAEVPDLINDAIFALQREYNFRVMEASVTYVTAPGITTLGSISTPLFKEYRDKGPYLLKNLTKSIKLLTALDTDVNMAVLNTATEPDQPEFVLNTVDPNTGQYNFFVAPFPDTASDWPNGNYRIVLPYYQYIPNLVNPSDTNWFVLYAREYIVNKATAEAFGLDWDYDSMALWLQRAKEKKNEVIKADKMSRLASVDTLVPMWRGALQPQVRR